MENINDVNVVLKHRDWLGQLLNDDRTANESTCDLVLESEGKQFKVHKSVLMLVSNYFRKMFTIEMMEKYSGIVNIEGIPPDRLENLIEFIYSGKIKITEENMLDVLDDAEYTEIEVLKARCASFICLVISAENCLKLGAFAQRYNLNEVKVKTNQCIEDHMSAVVQHDDFAKLKFCEMSTLLEKRKTNCEEAVFKGIVKWVNHDPLERGKLFEELFLKLDLTQLSVEFLAQVRSENLVNKRLACSNMLVDALFEISCPSFSYDFLSIGGEKMETQCIAYNVKEQTTKSLPNLKTGRFGATSVKVGDEVFVIGGANDQSCENPQQSCEMLNLTKQTKWKAIPDLLEARGYCGSAYFEEHIFVTGGYNAGALKSCEKFDIYNNKWIGFNNMMHERFGHGTEVNNGFIYCVGGHNCEESLSLCERYDIRAEKWDVIAPLNEERCYIATALLDGAIYAIGGLDSDMGKVLSTVERFQPGENKWEYVAPLKTARFLSSACVLDNKIYVFGGYSAETLKSVEVYDPTVNSWSFAFETERPLYGATVVALKNV
uniref:Kelch-like protein 20 n=1 Tax=Phallusia mammillata TaxID=59560 RepID=A0A6F9DGN8_9ASCI|nr:kelch-like protein 20 [Phallusia mammillata]